MNAKIKICGLTRECDIDYVNETEPDYIGFVFADSRRRISPKEAERLKGRVKAGICTIGVFMDERPEEMISLVRNGIIDGIQLHGREKESKISRIKESVGCPLIKAVRPAVERAFAYDRYADAGVDYFLFDSGGGTGTPFDWQLIPELKQPYFLAGGLHGGNIEAALQQVKPYGVDISSGVETDGVKDKEKIIETIRRIRNV